MKAKDTIIYVIENGQVEATNLYDHVMASATQVTSPRGVWNQIFVEEVEVVPGINSDDYSDEITEENIVTKWALKDWGRNSHNRTAKVVRTFDTEEEADDECFRLHELYDFAKDDQRDTQYWHSKEEAEKELTERNADV